MEGQPLSHYYISSAPGAGHNYPQVKDGSRPPQPGSSAAPHAAPPSGSGSHHGSFSPALAYPSSTRWAGGNAQGAGLNPPPPPPPPHYALPHGPVVYLHGGGASAASADPRSMMLGSPAAMNMNILPTPGPMLYPAMQMQPTTAAGSAVAYYLPAEATACPSPQYGNVAMAAPTSHGFYLFQHHQQQQQHSTLLNTASSAPNAATAAGPGASFPYLVLPTQQVDPNNMSSLSSFPSLPSSMAYPTSLAPQVAPAASHMMAYMQHQQQQQQRQATPLSGMGVPPYAQPPPPLHTFAAHSSGVDEGQHTAPPPPSAAPHVQGRRGETEAHALTSLTPLGLPTAAAKKAAKASSGGGNGGGTSKWRRSSHSVDSCSLNREASAVSQSLLSAQGLPYAEDPVEIDTTKRQLIVNYLPQRLTDERFRDLFRPYGELMEEESHIIYDFRHHKMVPVSITLPPPPMTTTDVPPSMDGALRTASSHASNLVDNTVSDVVKDAAPSSATTTQSTANLASGGTAASEDAALMSGVDGAVGTTVAATRSMPRSKGYGFIYYKDGASTERAIKELNGMEVDGKRIKVRYAEQQRSVDVPTACGGGDDGDAAKAAEVQLCNVAIDSDRSGDDEEEEELFNIEAFKMEDE